MQRLYHRRMVLSECVYVAAGVTRRSLIGLRNPALAHCVAQLYVIAIVVKPFHVLLDFSHNNDNSRGSTPKRALLLLCRRPGVALDKFQTLSYGWYAAGVANRKGKTDGAHHENTR